MARVLIAGVSTRAAAESAARAGFTVTAIDAFGDLDQHPSVRAISLEGAFTARAAVRAARSVECDAVVYLASFENHPNAVKALAEGRTLWGNPPEVIRRVRDPVILAEVLRKRGFAGPQVRLLAPETVRLKPDTTLNEVRLKPDTTLNEVRLKPDTTLNEVRLKPDTTCDLGTNGSAPMEVVPGFSRTVNQWLVKPLASGGGQRIRRWPRSETLPRGCYLQELIDGPPGSVVFVAAAGRAVLLGISRQLVGEQAFGAAGYQYCGNILTHEDAVLADTAGALAGAMTEEFGLVGVNGIDFIVRDGVPYAIEVNPRWCSSMELVERSCGFPVFAAHASACAAGKLPVLDLARWGAGREGPAAVGKAVVYARRDAAVGDTHPWLARGDIRDIPGSGERIAAGRPVCTVFATGGDCEACHGALVRSAGEIYAQLDAWETGRGC